MDSAADDSAYSQHAARGADLRPGSHIAAGGAPQVPIRIAFASADGSSLPRLHVVRMPRTATRAQLAAGIAQLLTTPQARQKRASCGLRAPRLHGTSCGLLQRSKQAPRCSALPCLEAGSKSKLAAKLVPSRVSLAPATHATRIVRG